MKKYLTIFFILIFILLLFLHFKNKGFLPQSNVGLESYKTISSFPGNFWDVEHKKPIKKIVYKIFYIGDNEYKVDFLSSESNQNLFKPKVNFEKISKKYSQYDNIHIFAAAFTPDWKNMEDVAMENGVLLKTFPKKHGGIAIFSDANKVNIFKRSNINNFEEFIKNNADKNNSFFGQKLLFFEGKNISKNTIENDPGKIIYRFLFQTKNYSGLIYFEEKYFLHDILKSFEDQKIKGEKIEKMIYLDVGSVSKSYHCINKKCFSKEDNSFSQKLNGYTNVLVFYK